MDNFQLMEDYLKGDLDQENIKLFNDKLQNEPEFEVEFRLVKAIQEGAKTSAKLSALSRMEKIEASVQEKISTKTEFNMKKLVSVAASLILIATVSYFTVFNTPDIATGQEIFDEYYQPYQNIASSIERSGETVELTSLKDKAYFAYDSRNFSEAKALFSDLLELEKNSLNYLYAGISAIGDSDFEVAKKNLNTTINHFEGHDSQAQWYLSMVLLGEENVEEAANSLIALSLSNSTYSDDANAVLEKLGIELIREDTHATVDETKTIPPNEGNMPDGSTLGRRQIQFGVISTPKGGSLRFLNDNPIPDLQVGDQVLFFPYKIAKRGKKEAIRMAYLIDKI